MELFINSILKLYILFLVTVNGASARDKICWYGTEQNVKKHDSFMQFSVSQ